MHDGAAPMTETWESLAARHGNSRSLATLLALAALCCLLMPLYNVVDYDVAFLTWAADRVLRGAVYGRDILDVNPPLGMLIYMPAALLAALTGFEWGVRLWMLALTLLSTACLWRCAGQSLRLPLAAMLLAFVTLAFPNHYAQREQIVLLLCAPYVAGPAQDRRWGLVSGVMAGVGFLMKPYFLIPLAALIALRRRIGMEENAIIAAGLAYAVILLVFFQPYLREMVPAAATTYWAISYPWTSLASQAAFIVIAALAMASACASQPAAVAHAVAALGFAAAAVLQQKGFVYHFIPAYGFLALLLTVATFNARRTVALGAVCFLLLEMVVIGRSALHWRARDFAAELRQVTSALNAEIDGSASYLSFVPEPYAAFPAAIHTPSRYAGIAICPIFIPAVATLSARQQVDVTAGRMARDQALRELANKPELVITLNVPYLVDGRPFDILQWLLQDPRFREAWAHYAADKTVGPFLLYRRR